MYFTVNYIDIKLNQDYADFSLHENSKTLILCDGIGEFPDSGKISKFVVEKFINKEFSQLSDLLSDNELLRYKSKNIVGGTTFICAINNDNTDKIRLEYLGNGGIIHLHGDFATNVNSNEPYRYGEIMIPHISPSGGLTRHISHNSNKEEHISSIIEMNLNYIAGDIILLFSDGISSLEEKVIIDDQDGRFWRFEAPSIQFILKNLNVFLSKNYSSNLFQKKLIEFNKTVLKKLKIESYLEDDASLGIIISENVLKHYKEKLND